MASTITRQGTFEPFFAQAALGQIAGHSVVRINGYTAALGNTAYGPAWEGLTSAGGLYAYPATAAPLSIVSTSASDTSALSVIVQGLDTNFNAITETIALNGTTAVTTVNSYRRVNRLLVSNGTNVGVITASISAVVYAQINAGIGNNQASLYTVPKGSTLLLMDVQTTTNNFSGTPYFQTRRYMKRNLGANTGQVIQAAEGVLVNNLNDDYRFAPVALPEGTDMQLIFLASSGTTNVLSVQATGLLVQNNATSNIPPL